jgi:hypothetical protein
MTLIFEALEILLLSFCVPLMFMFSMLCRVEEAYEDHMSLGTMLARVSNSLPNTTRNFAVCFLPPLNFSLCVQLLWHRRKVDN